MTWWLIPSIIGVIIAGVAIGLLISFFILKIRKQNVVFPFRRAHQEEAYAAQSQAVAGPGSFESPQNPVVETVKPASVARPAARENTQDALSPRAGKPSDILTELEKNLTVAGQPVSDHLHNFYTDIWSTRRSEFNSLDQVLLSEVTEAYVDMLLANNLVWLTTELKRDSQELTASYLKLKEKIAERLDRIMPQIRTEFQSGKFN
jgi:hypothetical protein